MPEISLRAYQKNLEGLLRGGEKKEAQEVIHHARHILTQYPRNAATYRLLGRALMIEGRYDEASEVFHRLLSAYPSDFTAHYNLGLINQNRQAADDAIWHLERSFDLQPNNRQVIARLRELYKEHRGIEITKLQLTAGAAAHQYLRSGMYDRAVATLEDALRRMQNRVDLRLLLAQALHQKGRLMDAAEASIEVLKALPYSVEANYILTELWLSQQRPSDAGRYLGRIEEVEPYLAFEIATAGETDENIILLEELDYRRVAQQELTVQNPDWLSSIEDDTLSEILEESVELNEEEAGIADDDSIMDDFSLEDLDDFDLDETEAAGEPPQPARKVTDDLEGLLPDEWQDRIGDMQGEPGTDSMVADEEAAVENLFDDLDLEDIFGDAVSDSDDFDIDDDLGDLPEPGEYMQPSSSTGLTGLLQALDSDDDDNDDWMTGEFDTDAEGDLSAALGDWEPGEMGDIPEVSEGAKLEDDLFADFDESEWVDGLETDDVEEEDAPPPGHTGLTGLLNQLVGEEEAGEEPESNIEFAEVAPEDFLDDNDSDEAGDAEDSISWMQDSGIEVLDEDEFQELVDVPQSDELPSSDVNPFAWMQASGIEISDEDPDDDYADPYGVDEDSVTIESGELDPMAWARGTGIEIEEDEAAQEFPAFMDEDESGEPDSMAWMQDSGIETAADDAAVRPAQQAEEAAEDDGLGWLTDDELLEEVMDYEAYEFGEEPVAHEAVEDEAEDGEDDEAEADFAAFEPDDGIDDFDEFEYEADDEESADEAAPVENFFDFGEDDELEPAEMPVESLYGDFDADEEDATETPDVDDLFAGFEGVEDEADSASEAWIGDEITPAEDDETAAAVEWDNAMPENTFPSDWQDNEEHDDDDLDWLDDSDLDDLLDEVTGGDGESDDVEIGEAEMVELFGDDASDDDEPLVEPEQPDWLADVAPVSEDSELPEAEAPVDDFEFPMEAEEIPAAEDIPAGEDGFEWLDEVESLPDDAESVEAAPESGDEFEWLDEVEALDSLDSTDQSEMPGADSDAGELEWLPDSEFNFDEAATTVARQISAEDAIEDELEWMSDFAEASAEQDDEDGDEELHWLSDVSAELSDDASIGIDDDEAEDALEPAAESWLSALDTEGDEEDDFATAAEVEAAGAEEDDFAFDFELEEDFETDIPEPAAAADEGGWLAALDSAEEAEEDEAEADEFEFAETFETEFPSDEPEEAEADWMPDVESLEFDEEEAAEPVAEAGGDWLSELDAVAADGSVEEETPDLHEDIYEEAPQTTDTGEWFSQVDDDLVPEFDENGEIAEEPAVPNWLSDVGAMPEESGDTDQDWFGEVDVTGDETFAEIPTEEDDWLSDEMVMLGEDGAADDAEAEQLDVPDWLSEVAPLAEADTESAGTDTAAEEDWFTDVEDADESAEPVAADQPDWLSNMNLEDAVAEESEDDFFGGDEEEEAGLEETPIGESFDWGDTLEQADEYTDEEDFFDDEEFELEDEEPYEEMPSATTGMTGMLNSIRAEADDEEDIFGSEFEEEFEEEVGDSFDWSAEISGADTVHETPEDEAMLDWMADVEEEFSPAEAGVASALAGIEYSEPDEFEGEEFGEEFDYEEEYEEYEQDAEPAATADIPDWLSEAEIEVADSAEEAEAEPAIPDWLQGMDVEEVASEAAQQEAASAFELEAEQEADVDYDEFGELAGDFDTFEEELEEAEYELEMGDEAEPEFAELEPAAEFVSSGDQADEDLAPADNAPDWLNAMVPGLDIDYEAPEDEPIEQSFLEETGYDEVLAETGEATREFKWLIDIVDEEGKALTPPPMPPVEEPAAEKPERQPRFQFSRRPAWLRRLTGGARQEPSSEGTAVVEAEDEVIGNDLPSWLEDFDDSVLDPDGDED